MTAIALRTRTIPSTLDRVSGYEFPALVDRLQRKLGITKEEAQLLFEDTKRFLFLAATHLDPVAPTPEIDEGWHAFILFTREYAQFCKEHFGFFLHHAPTVPGRESRAIHARLVARQTFGDDLSKNWGAEGAACENCAPLSNCNAPPADCGT